MEESVGHVQMLQALLHHLIESLQMLPLVINVRLQWNEEVISNCEDNIEELDNWFSEMRLGRIIESLENYRYNLDFGT